MLESEGTGPAGKRAPTSKNISPCENSSTILILAVKLITEARFSICDGFVLPPCFATLSSFELAERPLAAVEWLRFLIPVTP